jgi:hypothetical protein
MLHRNHEFLEIVQNSRILRHVSLVHIGVSGLAHQIVDLEVALNKFLHTLLFLLHFLHLV